VTRRDAPRTRRPLPRPLALCLALAACAAGPREAAPTQTVDVPTLRVLLEHPRVRAVRTTAGALADLTSGPTVVVALDDAAAGRVVWLEDPRSSGAAPVRGALVALQILRPPAPNVAPTTGWRPGAASSTGLGFRPLLENDRVSVLRTRMEVDAREGLHTHGSDTIIVHLSGGRIEDTAGGRTVVNTWTPGDVEFEAFGTSHSMRNVGDAIDVVVVVLRP
jgi:quercetin dioxygenase-like cupin family protein